MKLKLNQKFEHETTFSKQLSKNLDGKKLSTRDQKAKIETEHNTKQGRARQPDISVYQSNPIELKYRKLSKPFYIECKLGREYRENSSGLTSLKQIHDNLIQLLKYNYEDDSKKVKDLDKYGDRHVVVTTPKLVKEKLNVRDFEQEYINLPQLIRTLWKLGLGVMYRDEKERLVLAFNEQERAYITEVDN